MVRKNTGNDKDCLYAMKVLKKATLKGKHTFYEVVKWGPNEIMFIPCVVNITKFQDVLFCSQRSRTDQNGTKYIGRR